MGEALYNMEEILNRQITGFHKYKLSRPVHLIYVSQNLCDMLGVDKNELLDEKKDRYALLVHRSDRKNYSRFIRSLAAKEQTLTAEYRLKRKDGTEIYVRDTITSKKAEDGSMFGTSVLTDITDLKGEKNDLEFLNETIPCGILKYTCEKQPKITYINQKMIDFLRIPEVKEGELDYLEMYKSNIFLMVPMEERRRFSKYLDRVYSAEAPIAGEMTLLRCDGTRLHVFGWVTKYTNEQGVEEFQSVCMDITESHKHKKASETRRYISALADVYDNIFELNTDANSFKCLHCEEDSYFKSFKDVTMQIEDAMDKWLTNSVVPGDYDLVKDFFRDFYDKKFAEPEGKPPQVIYRAQSSTGELKQYAGIFIKIDQSVSLYCCRHISDIEKADVLRDENIQLKADMKELVMNFSDGIAAFEVTPEELVKPLYASENVSEFFGYTEEEWLPLTEKFTPIESFVAYSEASYEEFAELLRVGEAEFSYFDYKTETERRIKAICSQKEASITSPRFVMLYSVDGNEPVEKKMLTENRKVSIRTFGYFDVFVGDRPIAFRNRKSKELLALLVDRKGGYVTSEEAIGFLWEDEPASSVILARYRKVALRLKNTLEEYGIPDIIEAVDGKRRIVMENVDCDLYKYLSGKEEYSQLFRGSYLTNYSWGETTLGELMSNQEL